MPSVGFEPTISVSERAKTFHALDRAATVIDREISDCVKPSEDILSKHSFEMYTSYYLSKDMEFR
jgi:hypothetical protein